MNRISPNSTLLREVLQHIPKPIQTRVSMHCIKNLPIPKKESPKPLKISLLPENEVEKLCDANFKRQLEELGKKFKTPIDPKKKA